ncbi:hypothetical protein [Tepidicella baoligensis]|uniref:hypothetical protein n=1 Tax=Tepidicella baoligensis TaxID=2707016 RepID=UPI0015DA50EA|nr:hypothetical protein [Tepidicella baoligensis]
MNKLKMISRLLFILGLIHPALVLAADFEIIHLAGSLVLGGRVVAYGDSTRWGVVQTQSLVLIDKKKPWRSALSFYSVDCSVNGVEIVLDSLNMETDGNKEPRWVSLPGTEKYRNGFKPEEIQHFAVDEFIKRRNSKILDAADESTRRQLMDLKPFAPDPVEVALAFGCAVIKDKLHPKQAAESILKLNWLPGVKSIMCRYSSDAYRIDELKVSVRFDEKRGFVQVNNKWEKNALLSSDNIRFKLLDNDVFVDRVTGRSIIRDDSGPLLFGNCDVDDGSRKF